MSLEPKRSFNSAAQLHMNTITVHTPMKSTSMLTHSHLSVADAQPEHIHSSNAQSDSQDECTPPSCILSYEERELTNEMAAAHMAQQYPQIYSKMQRIAERKAERMVQGRRAPLRPRYAGTEPLLAFNRLLANAIAAKDEHYFSDLAAQQEPEFLYIGCSDSRVSANEMMGLNPGEVFVHRNVANIVSLSDLNLLAVLQYAVEHLKVQHILVAGHHCCGGVTAALNNTPCGLTGHWINHVVEVKQRHFPRMQRELPPAMWLSALCELNVLAQVTHLSTTQVVQSAWAKARETSQSIHTHPTSGSNGIQSKPAPGVMIHGWIYALGSGLLQPLVTLTAESNVAEVIEAAEEAVFARYAARAVENEKESRKTSAIEM